MDLHQHSDPGSIIEEAFWEDGIVADPFVDNEPFPDEEYNP